MMKFYPTLFLNYLFTFRYYYIAEVCKLTKETKESVEMEFTSHLENQETLRIIGSKNITGSIKKTKVKTKKMLKKCQNHIKSPQAFSLTLM